MEKCANCGKMIGNLETPHVYKEQVVCSECKAKLDPVLAYHAASSGSGSKKWLVGMVPAVLVVAVVVAGGLFVVRSAPTAATPAAPVTPTNAIPTFISGDDILTYINAHPEMNDDQLKNGLDAMFAGKKMLLMFAVVQKKGVYAGGVEISFDIPHPDTRTIRGVSYAVDGGCVYLQSSQTAQAQVLEKGADFSATGTVTVGIVRYSSGGGTGIQLYVRDAMFH